MKRATLTIDGTGLDYDRDYGIDRRTGWTACIGGCVVGPQFVPLHRAVLALIRGLSDGARRRDG